jgi:dTDP-4-amino-4,6-dideoxygalactose transaminase
MSRIPFMDLIADYADIRDDIDAAIRRVIDSGHFILGPDVGELEREIAAYLGLGHAAGVASGTDALVLALRALDIGPGDEVIVPAFTFFATAEAVMLVGATPVFADVLPSTYLIDPEEVERRITDLTKAVIPVHLYGHPADMDAVMSLASKHDLAVIEDAAQAMGAEWKGNKVGAIGTAGCLSFFPSKNLGGFGDGGMVVSDDQRLVERVKMLRTHGWRKKNDPEIIGYNSRLDTIQAAILRPKLRHLDRWNDARRERAGRYVELLGSIDGLRPPVEVDGARHVYHVYVVACERRDNVQEHLRTSEIGTGVYYPIPLHLTAPCSHLPYGEGDFPVAEQACRETLAIPLFPTMTQPQMERVAECIGDAMAVVRS